MLECGLQVFGYTLSIFHGSWEQIFLKNLLDGDTTSNTLSWRWVAGLHTQGKCYLATENNIKNLPIIDLIKKKNYQLNHKT